MFVSARVYATEDECKVREAIVKFVNLKTIEFFRGEEYDSLNGRGEGKQCLTRLRSALRKQKTLDVARSYIMRRLTPVGFSFEINKQAAYVGAVVFCSDSSESPLGSISFRVDTSDPQTLLDWLATPTVDGVPVDELRQGDIQRQAVKSKRNRWKSLEDSL